MSYAPNVKSLRVRRELAEAKRQARESAARTKLKPEDLVLWFRRESDLADTAGGFAHGSTEDIAIGYGVDPAEAFRLLKAAERKGLISRRKDRVDYNRGGTMSEGKVGWAVWDVALTREDLEFRASKRGGMTPNAKRTSGVEWVKGDGEDLDGHSLSWWKAKLKREKSGGNRLTVEIVVSRYEGDARGSNAGSVSFDADQLVDAKRCAEEWAEKSGGSANVSVMVSRAYEGTLTRFNIGEFRSAHPGYFVWSVDRDGMPFDRRGPWSEAEYDQAKDFARNAAMGHGSYDFVLTLGSDPGARSFNIERGFKARSGEVYYSSDLPTVGRRLKEYR